MEEGGIGMNEEWSEGAASIYIPEEWSEAAASICIGNSNTTPVVFICGPKNSGKTTFSRYLLNTLLPRFKRVAYLDTDVGQPEFTPPGCLSLTIIHEPTPDFTIPCLKTPLRCYFFGDISSKRDPKTYLSCVSSLYDHYTKQQRFSTDKPTSATPQLPLIINTPGWVKGIGYDILIAMLNHIAVTHVVKINIFSHHKDLPPGEFWLDEIGYLPLKLLELTPARKDSYNRSVLVRKEAHLIRELRLMAYFRQCFPSNMSITTVKELAHALTSHTPYQVPISSIKIRHLHCEVPTTEVFYSLNATIVGLAVSCKDTHSLPACVGLGIVRGIDMLKNTIYLITPVPHSILASVDLLLQGYVQIPTGLLQVQGCISPYMSANVIKLEDRVLSDQ